MTRFKAEHHDQFAIADLATDFGITARATRVFCRRDRARLMLILRGKRLGFSLKDITEYLGLYYAQSQHAQGELLLAKVETRLSGLERQQADRATTINELRQIRRPARDGLT